MTLSITSAHYRVLSLSPVETSDLPSVWRKITKRHDGKYVWVLIEKFIRDSNGMERTLSANIRVRVTSSGKDTKTDRIRTLFKNAIEVKAPEIVRGLATIPESDEREGEAKIAVHFLNPESLKKHLLETDLLNREEKTALKSTSLNSGNLENFLNSLSLDSSAANSAAPSSSKAGMLTRRACRSRSCSMHGPSSTTTTTTPRRAPPQSRTAARART
jgi:hypothetical protein